MNIILTEKTESAEQERSLVLQWYSRVFKFSPSHTPSQKENAINYVFYYWNSNQVPTSLQTKLSIAH